MVSALQLLIEPSVFRSLALAVDIVLCSWAKPLHSRIASLHPGVQNAGGNPVMD